MKSRIYAGKTTTSLVAIVLVVAVTIGFMLVPTAANAAISPIPTENTWVTDGTVYAIANDNINNIIYIGGDFTQVGPVGGPMQDRNYIAALNATTGTATAWDPSADDVVRALAVSDSGTTVYVGGDFWSIGGKDRNYIAAINATTGVARDRNWDADGSVYALAVSVSGTTLYAGGDFTSFHSSGDEPIERYYIAALGAGSSAVKDWNPDADGSVYALAVSGSTVYAGGDFTNIGGKDRNYIAALDATTNTNNATSWNPNAHNTVYALAVSGSTIYAGGDFWSIGGQDRNYIAALNATTGTATSWDPDADYDIYAIAVSGSTVYAGGDFWSIGGQERNYIAALDPTGEATDWDPHGDDSVYALLVSGTAVYAGGDFLSIGGEMGRSYFAQFDLGAPSPVPTTTGLSPVSKTAGEAGFTLTVNGSNFIKSSKVRWNGSGRTTTYVSPAKLNATITAADIASVGTASVTVFTPAPGGGTSNAQTFTVSKVSLPTTTGLSPASKIAGEAGFTLTVSGTNFVNGLSVVRWNGSPRTTTYVSGTQLTATINAADIASAGTASVTVFNPPPGGGTSNAQTFTINKPGLTVAAITPSSLGNGKGNKSASVTISGTNFVSGAKVALTRSDLIKPLTLRASHIIVSTTGITCNFNLTKAAVGAWDVVVTNPDGKTGMLTGGLTVNPAPTVTSVTPNSGWPGNPGASVTISGTNFVSGAKVKLTKGRWVINATSVNVSSSNTITCNFDLTSAALGSWKGVVTNADNGIGPFKFKVNPPPTVISITPNSAKSGSVCSATLTGSKFVTGATVKLIKGLSVINANIVSASSSEITCSFDLTGAATGAWNVVVTNPDGGTGTLTSGFTVN